jgi:NADH dehydrogenase FAD-containing subunit
LDATQNQGPIAVVGSGISGVQLALRLAEKGFDLQYGDLTRYSHKSIYLNSVI